MPKTIESVRFSIRNSPNSPKPYRTFDLEDSQLRKIAEQSSLILDDDSYFLFAAGGGSDLAWARNDRWSERFQWDPLRQAWRLRAGSSVLQLGIVGNGPYTYPDAALFEVGDRLPGNKSWAILRIGREPSEGSLALGEGMSWFSPPLFVSEDQFEGFDFAAEGNPSAILTQAGSLLLHPSLESEHKGLPLWGHYICPPDGTGDLGLMEDAAINTLYLSPIPSPYEIPFLTFGSRLPLTALAAMDDVDLFSFSLFPGNFAYSLTTGRVRFSQQDIDKADPFSSGFDPLYYKERIYYKGLYNHINPRATPTPSAAYPGKLVSRNRFYFRFNGKPLKYVENGLEKSWQPPAERMNAPSVVNSINAGRINPIAFEENGHVVLKGENITILSPGNSGDLFLPHWGTEESYNLDCGFTITFDSPNLLSETQFVSATIYDKTPASSFGLINFAPLLDLPGFTSGAHFRLGSNDLIPWQTVKYEFDQNRILFLETVQESGNITTPTLAIRTSSEIVPETLAEWGDIGQINVSYNGSPSRRLLPDEYRILSSGEIQILDSLTRVIARGEGIASGKRFFDPEIPFRSSKSLYLKILSGPLEGYYKATLFAASVEVSVPFSEDAENVPYVLIEVENPSSILVDAQYRNLPLFERDPFEVYIVSAVNRTLPEIPKSAPRFIVNDVEVEALALSRIFLGGVANGLSLRGFDTSKTFDVIIGEESFTATESLQEPVDPSNVVYWQGSLYFPQSILESYQGAPCTLLERFSSENPDRVEWQTGTNNVRHKGTSILWKRLAVANTNPQNGSFLVPALSPGDRIFASYIPQVNGLPGDRVDEYLPFFVTGQKLVRINSTTYRIDTDREIEGIDTVFVGGEIAGYAGRNSFSIKGKDIVFFVPIDPSLDVLANYRVTEAAGGETTGTVSRAPVYKPNLFIPQGSFEFSLPVNPPQIAPSSLVRVGASLITIEGVADGTITFTPPADTPLGSASPGASLLALYTEPLDHFEEFWTPIDVPASPINKGSNTVTIRGTISAIAGQILEVNGVPFTITAVDIGPSTTFTLGSPVGFSTPIPLLRISSRPVYIEGSRQFMTPANLADFEIVRFNGGIGTVLVNNIDYQIDSVNGILTLMDNQPPIVFGQSLAIVGSSAVVLAPQVTQDEVVFPRVDIKYGRRTTPPPVALSFQGYVYQPDQFYFSIADFDVKKEEYKAQVLTDSRGVQASFPASFAEGEIGEVEATLALEAADAYAAAILKEAHTPANAFNVLVALSDGKIAGSEDGPLKYDIDISQDFREGSVFTPLAIFSPWQAETPDDIINDIDDVIVSGSGQVEAVLESPFSRFFPRKYRYKGTVSDAFPFFSFRRFFQGRFISTTGEVIGNFQLPHDIVGAEVTEASKWLIGQSPFGASNRLEYTEAFVYSNDGGFPLVSLIPSMGSVNLWLHGPQPDTESVYQVGFDVRFSQTGDIIDASLPSVRDPAIVPLKEIRGQKTPSPGDIIYTAGAPIRLASSALRFSVLSENQLETIKSDDTLSEIHIPSKDERLSEEYRTTGSIFSSPSAGITPAVLYVDPAPSSLFDGMQAMAIIEVGQPLVPAGLTGIYEVKKYIIDGELVFARPRLQTSIKGLSTINIQNYAVWGDLGQGLTITQTGSGPYETIIQDPNNDFDFSQILNILTLSNASSTFTLRILKAASDSAPGSVGDVAFTIIIQRLSPGIYNVSTALGTFPASVVFDPGSITIESTFPIFDFTLFDSTGTTINGTRFATLSFSLVDTSVVTSDRYVVDVQGSLNLARLRDYTIEGISYPTSFEVVSQIIEGIPSTINSAANINAGLPFTFWRIDSALYLPWWEGHGNVPIDVQNIRILLVFSQALPTTLQSKGNNTFYFSNSFEELKEGSILYVSDSNYAGCYLIRHVVDAFVAPLADPASPFTASFYFGEIDQGGVWRGESLPDGNYYFVIDELGLLSSDIDVYNASVLTFTYEFSRVSRLRKLDGAPYSGTTYPIVGYATRVLGTAQYRGVKVPLDPPDIFNPALGTRKSHSTNPYEFLSKGDYDSEVVYDGVPLEVFSSSFDLRALHDPKSHGNGPNCFLRTDVLSIELDFSKVAVYVEPYWPSVLKDIGNGIPNVYSNSHRGIAPGMVDASLFGPFNGVMETSNVFVFQKPFNRAFPAYENFNARFHIPSTLRADSFTRETYRVSKEFGEMVASPGDRIEVERQGIKEFTRVLAFSDNILRLQRNILKPGDQFRVLRKGLYYQSLVAIEELIDSLFDLILESNPDYASQQGARCSSRDILSDDSSNFVNVAEEDIVFIPPSGQLQGPTGVASPVEWGQPYLSSFPLDDNRGVFSVEFVQENSLQVRSLAISLPGPKVLRETAYADPLTNSFSGSNNAVAPFPYKIYRMKPEYASRLDSNIVAQQVFETYVRILTFKQRIEEISQFMNSYVDSQRIDVFDNIDLWFNPRLEFALNQRSDGFLYSRFSPYLSFGFLNSLSEILSNDRYFWIDHRVNSASGTIAQRKAAHRRAQEYLSRLRNKPRLP